MDHLVWTPPIDHYHDYKESYNDDNYLDGDEVDLVVDVGSDIHDDSNHDADDSDDYDDYNYTFVISLVSGAAFMFMPGLPSLRF